MNSRRLGGLVLAMLLGLGWWFWPRPIANLKPGPGPIVALGDSLAAGTGSETRRGYLAVLSERLKVEIVNRGVPGDTTAMGLKRLESDVLSLQPALVIVQLGGNDFLQKVPLEETFQNLEQIVEQTQSRGAAVLLVGTQSGLFGNQAAQRYRQLSRRRQTGFVKNLLSGILTQTDLKADPIHPNDRGYERVADLIEPELRRMLKTMGRL